MSKKILVIDDEPSICEILHFNLSNEGFEITSAHSAEEALKMINTSYSLILLDVMMAGMSGFKMAQQLRKEGHEIPIIFLTAKESENDKLTGFSVGCDDYIAKPFSIKEVIARVKAVLKRHTKEELQAIAKTQNRLCFGDLVIDLEMKDTFIDGVSVGLTKTEFEILVLLASHPTHIFSREDIINTLWKRTAYVTERTIDVHITRLRKKLGSMSNLIYCRSGYGYRLDTIILPIV